MLLFSVISTCEKQRFWNILIKPFVARRFSPSRPFIVISSAHNHYDCQFLTSVACPKASARIFALTVAHQASVTFGSLFGTHISTRTIEKFCMTTII